MALIDATRDANARIRRYAGRHEGLVFIDVFAPMLDASGAPRAELFGSDGLHLNADGYALWRGLIEPVLR
ncbi:MAG TPA: GDSL-type esterase/lipase family protein [Tahibacter sp.]|nr:GDSL-type esterase/lipase family protein [Tahibacter sp.]